MSKQKFKTIYFPSDRTRSGKTARVTISIPMPNDRLDISNEFVAFLQRLSSRELRNIIGNPILEELEETAKAEGRTLSNYFLKLLKSSYDSSPRPHDFYPFLQTQLTPFFSQEIKDGDRSFSQTVGLTFREGKSLPIHRWYKYVEGFSPGYVRRMLTNTKPNIRSVYDPFGGCGTTQLEASMLGIPSFFSEINPFLAFVANTKVNSAGKARQNLAAVKDIFSMCTTFLDSQDFISNSADISLEPYNKAFPRRDYFVEKDLRELLAAKDFIAEASKGYSFIRDLLLLALAAITVSCSNMTRRADLRRRRSDEYKSRVVNVGLSLKSKIAEIWEDLQGISLFSPSKKITSDAKMKSSEYLNSMDLALTSPPYLNGTNYFRNTKLEMWLLDFIESEKDLLKYTHNAIWSGINNVSKTRNSFKSFDMIENVATILDEVSYDVRIPSLIRGYFSDMYTVLQNVYDYLKEDGVFVLDIGNSRFCGVDIPTDYAICEIGKMLDFEVISNTILAKRYSHDKSVLRQAEIILRKPKKILGSGRGNSSSLTPNKYPLTLEQSIIAFGQELPYKKLPYSKRSWGHRLHSLCSYQGKLKPSIAYWLVSEFSKEKMTILDPLGGVGTIALEGCLQGRKSITNDLNTLAFTVASAKVSPPSLKDAENGVKNFEVELSKIALDASDWEATKFGLNAKISDYFHEKTLEEILKARKYFLEKKKLSEVDAFIKASLLHILHGNRPYALSRKSHPITPFFPSGPFQYKNLVEKLNERIHRVLEQELPTGFEKGLSLNLDFRQLPEVLSNTVIDRIITSPPFVGLRFDRPNWLRLWFCGWSENDFHVTSKLFLERQQMENMDVYSDFFSVCSSLLKEDGLLIIHIGGSEKYEMLTALTKYSSQFFKVVNVIRESVESIEKHGINDKGKTTFHQFLFLNKK